MTSLYFKGAGAEIYYLHMGVWGRESKKKAGSPLKILPHTVINDKDEEVRKGPSINNVTGYS